MVTGTQLATAVVMLPLHTYTVSSCGLGSPALCCTACPRSKPGGGAWHKPADNAQTRQRCCNVIYVNTFVQGTDPTTPCCRCGTWTT